MLDSVEIQLSRGAVLAAGVSARSMLEAYIYLEWLLKADTDIRARHFYVSYVRQRRAGVRRIIPGTDEFNRFQKQINSLHDMQDPLKRAAFEKEAIRQDTDLTKILTNKNNKSINDQFDKKKKYFDVHWYELTGVKSIGDMAGKLSLKTEYDWFYSQFSDIAHASAFDKHIKFNGNAVIFEPLRSPEGIDTVVNVIASLAFRVYRLIIKKYFPKDLQSFNQSYTTQWRDRFLSVPKVVVKRKNKL